MATIEMSETVFSVLKRHAEPATDTTAPGLDRVRAGHTAVGADKSAAILAEKYAVEVDIALTWQIKENAQFPAQSARIVVP